MLNIQCTTSCITVCSYTDTLHFPFKSSQTCVTIKDHRWSFHIQLISQVKACFFGNGRYFFHLSVNINTYKCRFTPIHKDQNNVYSDKHATFLKYQQEVHTLKTRHRRCLHGKVSQHTNNQAKRRQRTLSTRAGNQQAACYTVYSHCSKIYRRVLKGAWISLHSIS